MLFLGLFSSSLHSHTGSGHNRLCLPPYLASGDQHLDSNQNGGLLYGSSYETNSAGVPGMRVVDNAPVACAMCEATRGAVFTIPGKSFKTQAGKVCGMLS